MISRVGGWSWDVERGAVILTPLDAPGSGAIRYRERLRPIRALEELAAAQVEAAELSDPRVEDADALVTREGEYGAVVNLSGRVDGEPAQLTVAVVIGDDWYAETAGLTREVSQFARFDRQVRELARTDRLHLGVRRRRFNYTPPAGWRATTPLAMYTTWTSPEPGRAIHVYPAVPREHGLSIGPPVGGGVADIGFAPEDISTPSLGGTCWELSATTSGGELGVRRMAVLDDGSYLYPLLVEATGELDAPTREAFGAVVGSVEPLPSPLRRANYELFSHMAEL